MINKLIIKLVASSLIVVLMTTTIVPPAFAQMRAPGLLPQPGAMLTVGPVFTPPLIKGITLNPDNPLQFDFLISPGDEVLSEDVKKDAYNRLIKYFLAALTVPEKDLWVNLSPYEENRVITDTFGATDMGRDLLAQDYLLKQMTAALMNPQEKLGAQFWEQIKRRVKEEFGIDDVPVDLFNKVWIVPDDAIVYEHGTSAFVIHSHLKVMLERDYLAQQKSDPWSVVRDRTEDSTTEHRTLNTNLIKQIILPVLEEEINTGKNFAPLRQAFQSVILSVWFKKQLKASLIGKVYVDQGKVAGIEQDDPEGNQEIYKQYIETFRQGAFNFIKEEYDPQAQQVVSQKYFSGGVTTLMADADSAALTTLEERLIVVSDATQIPSRALTEFSAFSVQDLDRAIVNLEEYDASGLGGGGNDSESIERMHLVWAYRITREIERVNLKPFALGLTVDQLLRRDNFDDLNLAIVQRIFVESMRGGFRSKENVQSVLKLVKKSLQEVKQVTKVERIDAQELKDFSRAYLKHIGAYEQEFEGGFIIGDIVEGLVEMIPVSAFNKKDSLYFIGKAFSDVINENKDENYGYGDFEMPLRDYLKQRISESDQWVEDIIFLIEEFKRIGLPNEVEKAVAEVFYFLINQYSLGAPVIKQTTSINLTESALDKIVSEQTFVIVSYVSKQSGMRFALMGKISEFELVEGVLNVEIEWGEDIFSRYFTIDSTLLNGVHGTQVQIHVLNAADAAGLSEGDSENKKDIVVFSSSDLRGANRPDNILQRMVDQLVEYARSQADPFAGTEQWEEIITSNYTLDEILEAYQLWAEATGDTVTIFKAFGSSQEEAIKWLFAEALSNVLQRHIEEDQTMDVDTLLSIIDQPKVFSDGVLDVASSRLFSLVEASENLEGFHSAIDPLKKVLAYYQTNNPTSNIKEGQISGAVLWGLRTLMYIAPHEFIDFKPGRIQTALEFVKENIARSELNRNSGLIALAVKGYLPAAKVLKQRIYADPLKHMRNDALRYLATVVAPQEPVEYLTVDGKRVALTADKFRKRVMEDQDLFWHAGLWHESPTENKFNLGIAVRALIEKRDPQRLIVVFERMVKFMYVLSEQDIIDYPYMKDLYAQINEVYKVLKRKRDLPEKDSIIETYDAFVRMYKEKLVWYDQVVEELIHTEYLTFSYPARDLILNAEVGAQNMGFQVISKMKAGGYFIQGVKLNDRDHPVGVVFTNNEKSINRGLIAVLDLAKVPDGGKKLGIFYGQDGDTGSVLGSADSATLEEELGVTFTQLFDSILQSEKGLSSVKKYDGYMMVWSDLFEKQRQKLAQATQLWDNRLYIHNTRRQSSESILEQGIMPTGEMKGIGYLVYNLKTRFAIQFGLGKVVTEIMDPNGWAGSVDINNVVAMIIDPQDDFIAGYLDNIEGELERRPEKAFAWIDRHWLEPNLRVKANLAVDLSVDKQQIDTIVGEFISNRKESLEDTPLVRKSLGHAAIVYVFLTRLTKALEAYNESEDDAAEFTITLPLAGQVADIDSAGLRHEKGIYHKKIKLLKRRANEELVESYPDLLNRLRGYWQTAEGDVDRFKKKIGKLKGLKGLKVLERKKTKKMYLLARNFLVKIDITDDRTGDLYTESLPELIKADDLLVERNENMSVLVMPEDFRWRLPALFRSGLVSDFEWDIRLKWSGNEDVVEEVAQRVFAGMNIPIRRERFRDFRHLSMGGVERIKVTLQDVLNHLENILGYGATADANRAHQFYEPEVEKIDAGLRKFLAKWKVTFHPQLIAFIHSNVFEMQYADDGYGIALKLFDVVAFPLSIGNRFTASYVHETLHNLSRGFRKTILNDGVTEYLTIKFIMEYEGYTGSMDEYLADRKGEFVYTSYVKVVRDIMEVTGEEALLRVYFSGDYDGIAESAIGYKNFLTLKYILDEYDEQENNFDFIKRTNRVLDKYRDAAVLNSDREPNEEDESVLATPVGGIDLNPAGLNLQIKRDGDGVALPIQFQDILNINIRGFVPHIIEITPVQNLPFLMGLGEKNDPQDGLAHRWRAHDKVIARKENYVII